MRYSPFLALIAVPLLLLAASPACAGPITYQLDDHPDFQAGYHIIGSITTDGTTGTIGTANVLSWDLTITDPNNLIVGSASSAASGAVTNLIRMNATDTDLTYIVNTSVAVIGGEFGPGYELVLDIDTGFGPTGGRLWFFKIDQPVVPFASVVPEPATLTLGLVGIGGLVGTRLARRRRAAAARR
jgi:hypothetical protein